MKKTISTLALIFAAMTATAAPRTAEDAMNIARNFVKNEPTLRNANNAKLTLASAIASNAKSRINTSTELSSYYIVNIEDDKGFVVVSGDDRFSPILGFSVSGNVADTNELPDGLQYWLSFLSAEMDAAVAAGYAPQAKASANAHTESVEPLLTTKWDQGAPYNNKIPNYATGCVATGTAQVMKYWQYPAQGIGSHTNGYFSQYSADFASTTYDWANMKDTYGGLFDTAAQVNAVATLMYQVGVATDMRWDSPAKGSGTPNMYAGNALINFFGYNKFLYAEQRDCLSLGAWKALIIDQLQTGHPLCYAGMTGTAGQAGHFFVLDGYDATTGLFHFNWGWSGKYDGYYSITALEPGTGGIGAGAGTFNYDQQMFVNVQPTETGEYVAHFDANNVVPANTSNKSNVTVNITNLAHNSLNFKGTAGLAIYNTDGTFKTYVASTNGIPAGLNPGSVYTGVYGLNVNLSSIENGNYVVCAATMHESYTNKVHPIRAYYGNNTYYNMTVSGNSVSFSAKKNEFSIVDTAEPFVNNSVEPNTVYQNVTAKFTIKVKNEGTTAFNDEVGVCIRKSRGLNQQYITAPCSLEPGEEKTITIIGKIDREPGDYNLYTCYGENGEYGILENSISIEVKDEATAINTAVIENADAPMYTISGVRINNTSNLQKGIYIQAGKKIYIK